MSDAVIDSCCLINLCAVGDLSRVLPPLGLCWHIPPPVRQETLFLRTILDDGALGRESVDLQPAIGAGILNICELAAGEETDLYVELARAMDDADAMALAIAKCRIWLLATDDRVALRYARDLGVSVTTTPELMQRWAHTVSPEQHELSQALRRIQTRAQFAPNPKSPFYEWWVSNAL